MHRELLCYAAAEIMTNDACAGDAKGVEQSNDPLCVRMQGEWAASMRIAPSVTEEIDDDEPMTCGHLRNDVTPEMPGGWESVKKDDGFARAACARGVVIQTRAVHVNELTAHERADTRRSRENSC
jgi:hypothetical protein